MTLIEAMQREYSTSKRGYYCRVFPLGFVLYVAAIFSALDLPDTWVFVLAAGTLVVHCVVFFLRLIADRHYGNGEQIRRLLMMQDGMGVPPTPLEIASIKETVAGLRNGETPYAKPYYASQRDPGDTRLLEIVVESGFFTAGLARRMSKVFFVCAFSGLVISLAVMVALFGMQSEESVLRIGAAFIVASFAFWTAGDFANSGYRFHVLQRDVEAIIKRCDRILISGSPAEMQSEAISSFGSYNAALAQCLPIPDWMYRWCQARLNDAWAKR